MNPENGERFGSSLRRMGQIPRECFVSIKTEIMAPTLSNLREIIQAWNS